MSKLLVRIIGGKSSKKWDKEVSLTVQDQYSPDGYTLKVQKKLLLEHSKYFKDLPESEMKKHRKIKLEDATITALQKIVTFMQKTSIRFTNHTEALETLKVAKKYEFTELINICVNHLITALDASNVCDVYEAASSMTFSHLEFSCLKLIDKQSDDILQTRGFITLKKAVVLGIIKRNSLNVSSELIVVRAVTAWGLNDSLKRGLDPNNPEMFMPVVRHLLNHVRFGNMTEDELKDPDVNNYLQLLSSCELWNRTRSVSCVSQTSSSSLELEKLPRQFVSYYCHNLGTYESDQHIVKDGEIFCLNVDVLKGRVFLTCVKLAFRPFAATKNSACLYAVLTVTNDSTTEQRSTRGTFMNTTDEACLDFSNPLSARESETIRIELRVKRAENICPVTIKKDVQIAMPDSKLVAMKVTPVLAHSESEDAGRCIFGEIQYFH